MDSFRTDGGWDLKKRFGKNNLYSRWIKPTARESSPPRTVLRSTPTPPWCRSSMLMGIFVLGQAGEQNSLFRLFFFWIEVGIPYQLQPKRPGFRRYPQLKWIDTEPNLLLFSRLLPSMDFHINRETTKSLQTVGPLIILNLVLNLWSDIRTTSPSITWLL